MPAPLVVYVSAHAHSSVDKAALLAGFGREHVRFVPTDAAHSMRPLFTAEADPAPYQALPNQAPLDEMNPPLAALRGPARAAALSSLRMNFVEPDAIPEDRLNRILWHTARGWQAPFPGTRHSAH